MSLRPAISTEAHRLNAYGDSSGQLHIAPQDGDYNHDDLNGGDQEILTEDDTEEEDDDDLGDLSETYVAIAPDLLILTPGACFRADLLSAAAASRTTSVLGQHHRKRGSC